MFNNLLNCCCRFSRLYPLSSRSHACKVINFGQGLAECAITVCMKFNQCTRMCILHVFAIFPRHSPPPTCTYSIYLSPPYPTPSPSQAQIIVAKGGQEGGGITRGCCTYACSSASPTYHDHAMILYRPIPFTSLLLSHSSAWLYF